MFPLPPSPLPQGEGKGSARIPDIRLSADNDGRIQLDVLGHTVQAKATVY